MLYIFGGAQCLLNAGGLQRAVQDVEKLGKLKQNKAVQYRKEGIFLRTNHGEEWVDDLDYWISDRVLAMGIGWDWFKPTWTFGNHVTAHKTFASPEYRTVIHGTNMTLDEFLKRGKVYGPGMGLSLQHWRHEGWIEYENRWPPGRCPQTSHIINLTWLITEDVLAEWDYQRLVDIIEVPGTELRNPEAYTEEHFSPRRVWDGKASFGRTGNGRL